MYQITRLPSGLVVATTEMPHRASVSLGLWVGVGGRYEPAELNGVSHFIEHLLFKGTPKRSAKEISQAVEGIGGYLNAFTGEESTCFYSKGRHDRFDELLDVLVDMFLNSKFDPAEIEKERGVIKEELAMYLEAATSRPGTAQRNALAKPTARTPTDWHHEDPRRHDAGQPSEFSADQLRDRRDVDRGGGQSLA